MQETSKSEMIRLAANSRSAIDSQQFAPTASANDNQTSCGISNKGVFDVVIIQRANNTEHISTTRMMKADLTSFMIQLQFRRT